MISCGAQELLKTGRKLLAIDVLGRVTSEIDDKGINDVKNHIRKRTQETCRCWYSGFPMRLHHGFDKEISVQKFFAFCDVIVALESCYSGATNTSPCMHNNTPPKRWT